MLVSLSLANDFRGRIYATGNPQACFELGTGRSEMTLRIPLGTECGTVQQVNYIKNVKATYIISANFIFALESRSLCQPCGYSGQSSHYAGYGQNCSR